MRELLCSKGCKGYLSKNEISSRDEERIVIEMGKIKDDKELEQILQDLPEGTTITIQTYQPLYSRKTGRMLIPSRRI